MCSVPSLTESPTEDDQEHWQTMGKKAERQTATHLEACTILSPEELYRIARTTAGAARGSGMKLVPGALSADGTTLAIEMRSSTGAFLMRGIQGLGSQGTVVLRALSDGDETLAVAYIDQAYTGQHSVMYIPVTSKSVIGFDLFVSFLRSLEVAIRREDPTAASIISDDRDCPVPERSVSQAVESSTGEARQVVECDACGGPLRPHSRFCPSCGLPAAAQSEDEPMCPGCRAMTSDDDQFCGSCGSSLTTTAQE